MIIVGFAGGENGTRGRVKAYDSKDGHLIWTFYTIPGPGEPGHETWPQDNDVCGSMGGATVWQTPPSIPDLGLTPLHHRQPGAGLQRPHPPRQQSLFRLHAGCRSQDRQVPLALPAGSSRHTWDYDSPNPVILFDVTINGRVRKAAAEASKTGWVYILDRITGKPLIGIDEKPVAQDARQLTSPTQPFPRGDAFVPHEMEIAPEDFPLVNQGRIFTPFWTDGVVAKPSPAWRRELAAEFLRSHHQLLLRVRQRQREHLQGRRRQSGDAA